MYDRTIVCFTVDGRNKTDVTFFCDASRYPLKDICKGYNKVTRYLLYLFQIRQRSFYHIIYFAKD